MQVTSFYTNNNKISSPSFGKILPEHLFINAKGYEKDTTWAKKSIETIKEAKKASIEKIEKNKKEAEKKKKKADAYAKQAKEWADKRVASVGNQITAEKSRNIVLEKELTKTKEKAKDMFNIINLYEKKFGKATDNLPKLK